jgi:hypothetical protein
VAHEEEEEDAAERAAGKVRGTAAVTPANVPVAAMVGRSSRAVSRRVEAVAQGAEDAVAVAQRAEDAVAVAEAGVGAEAEGIPAARKGLIANNEARMMIDTPGQT